MSQEVAATGRRVGADGLTDRQRVFVRLMGEGLPATEAAAKAGFSHPREQAHRLLSLPAVTAAINNDSTSALRSAMPAILKGYIQLALFSDSERIREKASWNLLHAGLIKPNENNALDAKEASKMSIQDLEEFIRQRQPMIDITPEKLGATDSEEAE
jgi:hypothetical protein